jgi:AraC family transcriptional regulator, arabinose operon regulatory protein
MTKCFYPLNYSINVLYLHLFGGVSDFLKPEYMQKAEKGFSGQRFMILPFYVMEEMERDELCKDLYIHSIGHYPNADHHHTARENGCSEYLLIYCVQGKGWYILNGRKHKVSANQIFILPANQPHSYGADKKEPWSIYWIHLKGIKAALISPEFIVPVTVASGMEHRIALFNEIFDALKTDFQKKSLQYACLTLYHFLASFRYRPWQEYEIADNDSAQSYVNLAIHFMNEQINTQLTLNDLAHHVHYSAPHLHKLFSKATGFSPIRYFLNLKIERACYYLTNTTYSVSQTAKILGFRDAYYFSRLFSKTKGVSPSEYRKRK